MVAESSDYHGGERICQEEGFGVEQIAQNIRALADLVEREPEQYGEPCELADGQLLIKGEPFRLEPTERAVLEAIAKHGAVNKTQLGKLSHVGDEAVNVLKNLLRKYQRRGLRVRLGEKRGMGGYWANVKLRGWYAQGMREAPKP